MRRMHRKRRRTALDLFRVGERKADAGDEHEERKDRIVEREPVPGDMMELLFEPAARAAREEREKSANRQRQADQPDHVEPAQGVK